ncbi:stress-induced acidophilic repeat motif-containing protein [Legionella sp. km772]|uniref:stress-induced acidophilic repeat motif-containing protein n=1 Tax=Legionella sp. km772 TaxID=2498111 RepID=UPI000F8E10DB|nr:stress-induced acidophilic repeat motif-containing protein [Legionella sp. km772]RUR09800.1 stress-induced acidophilic repeat motif-containing protein [Legionella sp. km772]
MMTGTTEGGKKAAAKQDMSEKGRKGGQSSHGGGRGSNLTTEDRKKGGENSHGGK